jgi:serine/threonine-protein kinase RsbT
MADDARDRVVPIGSAADIVSARQQGRSLASRLGFSPSELTVIATAISEVARNIVEYAGGGEIRLSLCQQGGRLGICVVACDKGPGIPDVERALRDGYSTHKGLGLGLPGARRLMDEFEIVSEVGTGTTVTMKKWAH